MLMAKPFAALFSPVQIDKLPQRQRRGGWAVPAEGRNSDIGSEPSTPSAVVVTVSQSKDRQMADVIHLEAGQDPPSDVDCLIVARDLTGAFYVPSPEVGYHRTAEVSSYPISDADRSAAIDRARGYADQHGIAKVYVVV
jgi:hypothetical protein